MGVQQESFLLECLSKALSVKMFYIFWTKLITVILLIYLSESMYNLEEMLFKKESM